MVILDDRADDRQPQRLGQFVAKEFHLLLKALQRGAQNAILVSVACAAAGIDAPIIPGILPIENWKGVVKFAARCGAHVPQWLADAFETAERDGRSDLLATAVCTELCTELLEGGVEDLHFYTLNKPTLTRDVVHALGLAPEVALENVA